MKRTVIFVLAAILVLAFSPVSHAAGIELSGVLEVEAGKTGIRKSMKQCNEYEEPLFIECDGLADFAERNERFLVPTSLALIRAVAGSL